jgi:plastocyanin
MMQPEQTDRLETLVLALIVPLVVVITVLVTLSVTSDFSSRANAPSEVRTSATISIKAFRFSPNPIVVRVGTPITITNDDSTAHTLTATDKTFDTGEIHDDERAQITITTPGRYRYFCRIHRYMTGTIEAR